MVDDFDEALAREKERLASLYGTPELVDLPDISPHAPKLVEDVKPFKQTTYDPDAWVDETRKQAESGAFGNVVSRDKQMFEDAPQVSGVVVQGGTSVWVPMMGAEEYEKGVAPFGKKMVPVPITPHTDPHRFKHILVNAHAEVQRTGTYTVEGIAKATEYSQESVQRIINSPEFIHAAKLRGIEIHTTGLTVRQMNALVILTDSGNGTMTQRLKKAGITHAIHRNWLKQPAYRQQWENMYEGALSDSGNALLMLDTLVDNGDLSAVKFKLELNGRYQPNRQQNIDFMAMLAKILEILQSRIKDPEVLRAVAGDLQEVVRDLPKN